MYVSTQRFDLGVFRGSCIGEMLVDTCRKDRQLWKPVLVSLVALLALFYVSTEINLNDRTGANQSLAQQTGVDHLRRTLLEATDSDNGDGDDDYQEQNDYSFSKESGEGASRNDAKDIGSGGGGSKMDEEGSANSKATTNSKVSNNAVEDDYEDDYASLPHGKKGSSGSSDSDDNNSSRHPKKESSSSEAINTKSKPAVATSPPFKDPYKPKWKPKPPPPYPPRPSRAMKGSGPLLFTCPDGRKGLHVVHTRLMLNMVEARGARGTFRASRMLLFKDLSLPSLARQTAQNFLYYVSYDHAQDFPFLESCYDILTDQLVNGASLLYLPERGFQFTVKAHQMLAFPRLVNLTIEFGLATREEMESVQLYISSRLDNDDAGNLESLKMTQDEACSTLNSDLNNRVLLTYMEPKYFWLPDPGSPYGRMATVPTDVPEAMLKRLKRAMLYRPLMQSLSIEASLLHCYNAINCYSHYHYQPQYILYTRNTTDCPFLFNFSHNVRILRPPNGAVGGLYSRTSGSWYAERNNRGYKFLDFNEKALDDCGITRGDLASTNLMLSMLSAEAEDAMKLSLTAVGGFGGIGVMNTWRRIKDFLYRDVREYRNYYNQLNETYNGTMALRYRAVVHNMIYGRRWEEGKQANYTKAYYLVLKGEGEDERKDEANPGPTILLPASFEE